MPQSEHVIRYITFTLLQSKEPNLLKMNCLPVTLHLKVGLHLITLQQRHPLFWLPLLQHLEKDMLWLANHLFVLTHLLILELYDLLNIASQNFLRLTAV